MRSTLLRAFAGAVLAVASTCSQALVFAINEGVTYRVGNDEIRAKYTAIAADLSKLLKQPVSIEPVADYPSLRRGLAAKQYDLAMIHPAHLSIEAIKKSGYKLLVVTKGFQQYTANFLVKTDSPMQTLADLRNSSLGLPDEDSITSWMVRATLRDTLGTTDQVKFVYTRYQDAVPFFVDNNLTKAGATAAGGVIKAWQTKGGKILGKSRPVPIKHIIASPVLLPEQVEKVREYLLSLDTTEEGKKKLEATKFTGFAAYSEADMLSIGNWLGL
ncbi:MAG TPA: phosphate/phosphite/phosphonate ABC transporter substrate-binding protein [Rhizobacter sp.]|nr:phosphate/phosphite/phosphonate ABC transporter substrate-binding protein [Rhizobacter sp.]